jgi:hypothetical protein
MPRVRAESSKGATASIATATNTEQSVFAFMSYFLNEILLNRFCLYGNFIKPSFPSNLSWLFQLPRMMKSIFTTPRSFFLQGFRGHLL